MQRHQRKLLFPVGMSQFIPVCFLSPFPQHGSQQLQQQQQLQQSARRRQTSFSSSEVVSGTRFRREKLSYLGDRAAKIEAPDVSTLRPKRQSGNRQVRRHKPRCTNARRKEARHKLDTT